MGTFAAAFKSEIVRLSRREVKRAIAPLKSAAGRNRSALAAMKAQLAALKQQAARHATPSVPGVTDKELKKARFSGRLVRTLRTRLGLSQAEFGKLAGVSGLGGAASVAGVTA